MDRGRKADKDIVPRGREVAYGCFVCEFDLPARPFRPPGHQRVGHCRARSEQKYKASLFWFILFYSGVTLVGTADAAGVKSAFSSRSSSFSFFLSSL